MCYISRRNVVGRWNQVLLVVVVAIFWFLVIVSRAGVHVSIIQSAYIYIYIFLLIIQIDRTQGTLESRFVGIIRLVKSGIVTHIDDRITLLVIYTLDT